MSINSNDRTSNDKPDPVAGPMSPVDDTLIEDVRTVLGPEKANKCTREELKEIATAALALMEMRKGDSQAE